MIEETLTVNDMRTRYLIDGPEGAPTVVFLHDGAWGASADVTWGDVLAPAAHEFRVIAPDMLGFGGSAKAVRLDESPFAFRIRHVFALLDRLGVDEPVHLVGNSFGGSLALRALTDAAVAPRIASVVTISGTGGPWRTEASAELGPFDGTEADIRRIVGLLCDDFPGLQEQVRSRYEWAQQPGHYAGVMAVHQSVPEPLQAPRPADPYPGSLQGVKTPVLLTECLRDPLVESGWTAHLRDVLPHAQVAELPHKHAPNISHPEETWEVLRDFIAETVSTRDDGVQLVAD